MSIFTCPFCSVSVSADDNTEHIYIVQYDHVKLLYSTANYFGRYPDPNTDHSPKIKLTYRKCNHCGKYSVALNGKIDGQTLFPYVYPLSNAKQFPNYVPQQIRSDYMEAKSIVELSPKASATLSRRCLQGIIADFWDIKETNLSKAIQQLQTKVDPLVWKTIDNIRKVGNIGAHMARDVDLIIDVDPAEADQLLMFIEFLVESWYINRHRQEELMESIDQFSSEKQALRSGR